MAARHVRGWRWRGSLAGGDALRRPARPCPNAIRRSSSFSLQAGAIWRDLARRRDVGGLFLDAVAPWDSKNQFYAFFRFLASALHSGATPFWNPYHYGGHPSVADPQSLVFAPLFVAVGAVRCQRRRCCAFDLIVLCASADRRACASRAIGCARAAGRRRPACWRRWCSCSAAARPAACSTPALIVTYAPVPAGAAAAAARAATPLDRSSRVGVRRRRRRAGAGTQPGRAAVLLRAGRGGGGARSCTAERPLRYLRERAAGAGRHGGRGRGADRGADAADHAVRGAVEPAGCRCSSALLEASLYPANLATACRRRYLRLARLPATGDRTTRPSRRSPSVDESFNYLFVGSVPVVLLLWFGIAGGRACAARPHPDRRRCWRSRCSTCWAATRRCSAGRSTGCRA